ncbi:hypothetical protein FS749_004690 [Ceratobasidium sp. UAMH 11750]|nr:hypothetical protein FS749_004690 [Ceratobasidium sp. UAMH 11750]
MIYDIRTNSWNPLVLRSRQQPLLPRLSHLAIRQGYSPDLATRQLMWLSILLTDSVTSVDLNHSYGVSALGLAALLQTISNLCPHIQKLALPSTPDDTKDGDAGYDLLHLLSNQPSSKSFLALSSLCELTTDLSTFETDLAFALGDLPKLKHLRLLPGSNTTVQSAPLRGSLLPALEQLTLRATRIADMATALGDPSLAHNIVTFRLEVPLGAVGWNCAEIFLMLLAMPNLTNLVLDHVPIGDPHDISDRAVLDVLSQLPLQVLHLYGARFTDFSDIHFATLFPSLTELRMFSQVVDLRLLARFAMIPNLRYLTVDLSDILISDLNFGDLPVCPAFEILDTLCYGSDEQSIYPDGHVHNTARYFLALFPNIKRIIWRGEFVNTTVRYYSLLLLNTRIAIIRERRGARVKIAEQYGWDVANRLLPDESHLCRLLESFV